jgi:recombination protein RecT
MVKGLTELALRSGQIHALIAETVYEGQLVKKNKFTGEYVFDEDAKTSDKIIGFMAYIRLANGFEKYEYMTVEEIKAHAMRFSQTFKKGFGVWKEHFEEMAKKTVLRRILTRWAPKSLEMQQGLVYDQSVVKGDIDNVANATAEYFDGNGSSHVVEDAEVVEVDEATGEVVDTAKAEQF